MLSCRIFKRCWKIVGACVVVSVVVFAGHRIALAQSGGFGGGGGFSSASVSAVRSGMTPPPEAIIVEEFYNYHFHDIPTPKGKEAISLDARWGANTTNPTERQAYLQVGLATTRDIDLAKIRPLNIAFVIDRSGSMANERIANVKKSLLVALKKLRPVDRVSIVTFGSDAEVIVEPQLVKDRAALRMAIEGIRTNGSTNLCAGLMLGYRQVDENFDQALNNRVILLTDGNANEGVKSAEQIARKSAAFNKRGIELSTIGLGQDFNHSLIRRLAQDGGGLLHFVADDEDIEKVFVDELDGLLSAVAKELTLTIEFDKRLSVDHVYGYSPRVGDGRLVFALDPLNTGTTQVVLARFRVDERFRKTAELPVSVKLSYRNIATGKLERLTKKGTLVFGASDRRRIDPLRDASVRRNITIADLAHGIKRMAELARQNNTEAAQRYMEQKLKLAARRYPTALDKEVVRTKEIAEKYLKEMSK